MSLRNFYAIANQECMPEVLKSCTPEVFSLYCVSSENSCSLIEDNRIYPTYAHVTAAIQRFMLPMMIIAFCL